MRNLLLSSTLLALGLGSSPAFSQVASSSAYAVGVNQTVTVGNVVTANVSVGPLAASSGSAPPAYKNNGGPVASLNQTTQLATTIGTPLAINEALSATALYCQSAGKTRTRTAPR